MEAIYSNFDGLEISFQCAVNSDILNQLKIAKEEAQKNKRNEIIKLGNNEKIVSVGETGARGGYTFTIDTGIDGETWFIVDNNKKDGWNVRVSAKSLNLALNGYDGTKNRIMDFLLNDLMAIGIYRKDLNGNSIEIPIERISRVDFCIDFKTDKFIPIAKSFIGKGRFKKRVLNLEPIENNIISEIIYSGQCPKYFRMGSMPYRQVVLYDKISDITEKRKNYWWDIWNIKKLDFKGQIWRVEARAGKKELNEWNLKKFTDFDKKIGDVISTIFKNIKYTIPSDTDQNISRWPLADFWKEAIKISENKLANQISNSERKRILEGHRNEIKAQFEKLFSGQLVSYAALTDHHVSEIPAVLDALGDNIFEQIRKNPQKFIKNHENAKNKYSELK